MVAKITVAEGEFAGWRTYDTHGTFDQVGGRMHGGCLMTFADIAMFQTAYQEMEGASGVTVQLDSTFIDGAYVGELVEATGEVIRAGKSLIFVRGLIEADGWTLMTFSGVIRKFEKR